MSQSQTNQVTYHNESESGFPTCFSRQPQKDTEGPLLLPTHVEAKGRPEAAAPAAAGVKQSSCPRRGGHPACLSQLPQNQVLPPMEAPTRPGGCSAPRPEGEGPPRQSVSQSVVQRRRFSSSVWQRSIMSSKRPKGSLHCVQRVPSPFHEAGKAAALPSGSLLAPPCRAVRARPLAQQSLQQEEGAQPRGAPWRFWSAARVAVSKTSRTPSLLLAEHSR